MLKKEFGRRRKRLMDIVNTGGIAILPNAPVRIRNRGVHYPYRSESDFFFLSLFTRDGSTIVMLSVLTNTLPSSLMTTPMMAGGVRDINVFAKSI